MATADNLFLDLRLNKVNFYGRFNNAVGKICFGKSLVFSGCSYLKLMSSKGS